jgi:hypothetical protein
MSLRLLGTAGGRGLAAAVLFVAAATSTAWSAPTDPINPLQKRFLKGKPLSVCDQGSFFIGGVPKVTNYATSTEGTTPHQIIIGQSYVQFQIPSKRRKWPIIMVHGSSHTGAALDATANGKEGWLSLSVRNNLATFVMDQPGRGRSGSDASVINEAKALIQAGNVTQGLAMLPTIGGISNSQAWTAWFGHILPTGTDILTGTMIRHGDPGDPDTPETDPPSHGHGDYPPAFQIPPVDRSIDPDIAARVGAIGPAPNPANNAYLALNYYKQLVPNFEALLPTSECPTCNPTTVAPDSTWSGRAMADLVEHLGGAIVSPHSQSGIHLLHMIRILRERGKLHLVKGIIIPESAIGLNTFEQAGITPQDFDHIPFLLMNGDYRQAGAREGNRAMIAAMNASPTRSVGPATYIDLDGLGGRFLGTTHMTMVGTNARDVFNVALRWADRNIRNPLVTKACRGGKGHDDDHHHHGHHGKGRWLDHWR